MTIKDRLLAVIGAAAGVHMDLFCAQLQTEIGAKAIILGSVVGATRTLLQTESGSTCVFDRAAGTIFTLPAPVAGLRFDFPVSVTATSNNHKIITDAGTTLLLGSLLSCDTDSSNAVAIWTPNGTTHAAITMNGGTTGGLAGSRISVECVDATHWVVTGTDLGSGVVATPFAVS